MHPGPLNRGVEIAADVADGENLIARQVISGLAVRMAILYQCLAASLSEEAGG
jgi:aspartate carbamoyltransferase catalytic subunit